MAASPIGGSKGTSAAPARHSAALSEPRCSDSAALAISIRPRLRPRQTFLET